MSTRPCPDIERHRVADRTAHGTCLGTRIPAVAPEERLARACGLVCEKTREHAPARIGRGFRETVVCHDPLHMQVFDHDNLVFVDDAARQLVQIVPPGTRDTLMRAGHQPPRFVAAVRSFLLARELALFALEVLFRLRR